MLSSAAALLLLSGTGLPTPPATLGVVAARGALNETCAGSPPILSYHVHVVFEGEDYDANGGRRAERHALAQYSTRCLPEAKISL